MPSPLGHALAGVAAGWAIAGPPRTSFDDDRRRLWRTAALFGVLGMLPDLDLLFNAHSGPTHGLGSALIVGLTVFVLKRQTVLAAAAASAYGSHTLLDWLGSDTSAPIGIMALWPFNNSYYESNVHLFEAISRRYWLPGFWEQNIRAVIREVIILVPLVLLVLFFWRQPLVRTAQEKKSRGAHGSE